ncbi:MAG: alpha-E domain-containing protein, partial [Pseudomonadales bacterium]
LGERLTLPGLNTFWCGDADARAHVLAHADRLTLLHAFRPRHLMTAGATEFMTSDPAIADPEALRRALELHPQNHVGVEPLPLSTVPCLTSSGVLRPAPMVMRVYVAATSNGYQVMDGGLVKVSGADIAGDERTSKDVWVLSKARVEPETLLKPLRAATLKRSDSDLASKTADDLFWLGRYLERADASTRLLRSLFLHLSGEASFGNVPVALPILTGLMHSFGHLSEHETARMRAAGFRGVENEISNLLFEPSNPDSLAGVLGNVARTADQVRERLSVDALRLIERLTNLQRLKFRARGIGETVALLNELSDLQSALSGLIHENMTRGYGWRFLDMGRRIERARYGITIMKALLVGRERGAAGVLGMQLELADSLITYRSRYKTEPELAAALDLILADDSNPRSLIFQFAVMRDHLAVMPLETHDGRLSRAQRNLISTHTELLLADVDALAGNMTRGGVLGQLRGLLERAEDSLGKFTDLITQTYFSHSIGHRVTGNVIRSQDDAL